MGDGSVVVGCRRWVIARESFMEGGRGIGERSRDGRFREREREGR